MAPAEKEKWQWAFSAKILNKHNSHRRNDNSYRMMCLSDAVGWCLSVTTKLSYLLVDLLLQLCEQLLPLVALRLGVLNELLLLLHRLLEAVDLCQAASGGHGRRGHAARRRQALIGLVEVDLQERATLSNGEDESDFAAF